MHLQSRILSRRVDDPTSASLYSHSTLATEFNPALKWLGHRVAADHQVLDEVSFGEDDCDGMSVDDEVDDDEIEEW